MEILERVEMGKIVASQSQALHARRDALDGNDPHHAEAIVSLVHPRLAISTSRKWPADYGGEKASGDLEWKDEVAAEPIGDKKKLEVAGLGFERDRKPKKYKCHSQSNGMLLLPSKREPNGKVHDHATTAAVVGGSASVKVSVVPAGL